MIRGVSFRIRQDDGRILCSILKSINIRKYTWYNIQNQEEAWDIAEGNRGKEFLEKACYDGNSMWECMNQKHYIIFLKLEAFLQQNSGLNVQTYEEFQKNDCEILLLIYDCEYVEIFLKENRLSEKIYNSAVEQGFEDVEYITDINDRRRIMDVL